MRKLFVFGAIVACFSCVITMIGYETKLQEIEKEQEDLKKRYVDIHGVATDKEIAAYEYIFKIECDSTCYH